MLNITAQDYVKRGEPYEIIQVRNRNWCSYRPHRNVPKFITKVVPRYVKWINDFQKLHRVNVIWLRKIENRVQAIVRVGEYREWQCDLYTYYIDENITTVSELKLNKKYEPYGFEEDLRQKKQTLTRNTKGYFIKARNGLIYEVLNPGVISSAWTKITPHFLVI